MTATGVIAWIDAGMAIAIMFALSTQKMMVLPKWHRIWIAVIAVGLASQFVIEYSSIDRIRVPIWALKDVGIWGLVASYSIVLIKQK